MKLVNKEKQKELIQKVNKAKSYLKSKYKSHCTNNNECASHCIDFALSKPLVPDLQSICSENHTNVCPECTNVTHISKEIKYEVEKLPACHEKQVALHEIELAAKKIGEWQHHIIRGKQQGKARDDAFESVDDKCCIWIRDFAQKYNPTRVSICKL